MSEAGRGLRVAIAGGFTSGHVFVAVAIAEALLERDPAAKVTLVGSRADRGLRGEHHFEELWIDGIERRFTPGAILRNLTLLAKLPVSEGQAAKILRRDRTQVVVGVGGYASVPLIRAAHRAGIPALLHEQNMKPGLSNRILAKHAQRICLGMRGGAPGLARPGTEAVYTGTPLRRHLATPIADPHATLGLDPNRQTLLVLGGSRGSPPLNKAVLEHLELLGGGNCQLLWQCGHDHEVACRAEWDASSASGHEHIHLAAFLEDMASAYAAADVVITSAGALSLAELASMRKPAVLFPNPDVTADHQRFNAEAFARAGAALTTRDPKAALHLALDLIPNPQRRLGLANAIGALASPDAADRIVDEILGLASG